MAKQKKFVQNDNNLAIAYYRYSSHAQNETSIEQQRTEAERYANAHGFRIIKEYADEALSGTSDDRPQFQLMLSEVGRIRPAALIVWKTDRIARNRIDSALAKKTIRDAGCTLHYVAEAIPQESPEGALFEGILESMAEFYSKQLRQNIDRGMRYNAENCLYNGHPTLGYKPEEGKKANKKILINPDTAPIVQRIFADYAGGKPLQVIVNELNNDGLVTVQGKKFTVNSLRHILHNEAYIGTYKHGDIVIENGIPALVSKELFRQVQERFVKNKRRGAQTAAGLEEASAPRYWLTGKLFCGYCGDSMQGVSGTSKTGAKHYYYYCKEQRKHHCTKKPVKKDMIENAVLQVLYGILANSENSFRLATEAVAYYEENYKETNYMDALEAELKDTQKALDNLVKAIEMGIFSETTQKRLMELENRKKGLLDAIEAERVRMDLLQDAHSIEVYFQKYSDPDRFDDDIRDEVLDYFVDKIFVYDDRIIVTGKYFDGVAEQVMFDELTDDSIEFDSFAVSSTKNILAPAVITLRLALFLSFQMECCIYPHSGISPTPSNTRRGRYGNRSISARSVTPDRTSTVSSPVSIPAIISVSMRSPIMTVSPEWAPNRRRPVRIINGFGFPTKYAFFPVAISMGAIKARQPGRIPLSDGPVKSLFVPIRRAP